jgi:RNA polymerase sigma-70 factor (ECF subfamily)
MTEDVVPVPDEVLLERIAAGDAAALTMLFRRRQQNVYRFALHLTGSPAVADDVTQDVFVEVIRSPSRFVPGRSAVAAWLCGIARNLVRRRLEADHTLEATDDGTLEAALPVVPAGVLEDLAHAERLESLRKAILTLPLRYREAVVLCDLHEMPYAEAADAIGCAIGTLRSRLHRGRALLTAKMLVEQQREREAPTGSKLSRCIA